MRQQHHYVDYLVVSEPCSPYMLRTPSPPKLPFEPSIKQDMKSNPRPAKPLDHSKNTSNPSKIPICPRRAVGIRIPYPLRPIPQLRHGTEPRAIQLPPSLRSSCSSIPTTPPRTGVPRMTPPCSSSGDGTTGILHLPGINRIRRARPHHPRLPAVGLVHRPGRDPRARPVGLVDLAARRLGHIRRRQARGEGLLAGAAGDVGVAV